MIQTYLSFLYKLRFHKQKNIFPTPVLWPTTHFQQWPHILPDTYPFSLQISTNPKSDPLLSFLFFSPNPLPSGSSDRALRSSKGEAYPRIHVRPSLAHDPFFTFFYMVHVCASLFSLFLLPSFLFKMWFSAYFLYFEMAHLLFSSVTVQLMVVMTEKLHLAFMLKRKVKFKSLFFFVLCSWKIGDLRMVHLCFIAFLGVWTLNI